MDGPGAEAELGGDGVERTVEPQRQRPQASRPKLPLLGRARTVDPEAQGRPSKGDRLAGGDEQQPTQTLQ